MVSLRLFQRRSARRADRTVAAPVIAVARETTLRLLEELPRAAQMTLDSDTPTCIECERVVRLSCEQGSVFLRVWIDDAGLTLMNIEATPRRTGLGGRVVDALRRLVDEHHGALWIERPGGARGFWLRFEWLTFDHPYGDLAWYAPAAGDRRRVWRPAR